MIDHIELVSGMVELVLIDAQVARVGERTLYYATYVGDLEGSDEDSFAVALVALCGYFLEEGLEDFFDHTNSFSRDDGEIVVLGLTVCYGRVLLNGDVVILILTA